MNKDIPDSVNGAYKAEKCEQPPLSISLSGESENWNMNQHHSQPLAEY